MVNETVIRLKENNIVEIESVDSIGVAEIKTVTFNDLVTALMASVGSREEKELSMSTGVLPINRDTNVYTIYTKLYDNGIKVIGLFQPAHRTTISYYDSSFEDVGVPGLVYVLKYNKDQVTSVRIGVVADEFPNNDSHMYEYPFSNVTGGNGRVCFGRNNIFDIKYRTEVDLHSIPRMFLAMPNNDDSYGKNTTGLAHRKLLEELRGKDFPLEYLKRNLSGSKQVTLLEWLNK